MYSIFLQAQADPGFFQKNGFFILMLSMGVVMYFFMIRPQQKKVKDQKKFSEEIKKGDYVVTIGGVHGRVSELEGNTFVLEAERGARIRFSKSAISMESTQSAANKKPVE